METLAVLITVIMAEITLMILGLFFTVFVGKSKYKKYVRYVQPLFLGVGVLVLVGYIIYWF